MQFILVQNRHQTHDLTLIGSGANGLGILECCVSRSMYKYIPRNMDPCLFASKYLCSCISGSWCIRSCVLLNLCINVYCIFVYQGIYISCVYQWIQLYLYPNIFVDCISASLCIDTSLIPVLLYL